MFRLSPKKRIKGKTFDALFSYIEQLAILNIAGGTESHIFRELEADVFRNMAENHLEIFLYISAISR